MREPLLGPITLVFQIFHELHERSRDSEMETSVSEEEYEVLTKRLATTTWESIEKEIKDWKTKDIGQFVDFIKELRKNALPKLKDKQEPEEEEERLFIELEEKFKFAQDEGYQAECFNNFVALEIILSPALERIQEISVRRAADELMAEDDWIKDTQAPKQKGKKKGKKKGAKEAKQPKSETTKSLTKPEEVKAIEREESIEKSTTEGWSLVTRKNKPVTLEDLFAEMVSLKASMVSLKASMATKNDITELHDVLGTMYEMALSPVLPQLLSSIPSLVPLLPHLNFRRVYFPNTQSVAIAAALQALNNSPDFENLCRKLPEDRQRKLTGNPPSIEFNLLASHQNGIKTSVIIEASTQKICADLAYLKNQIKTLQHSAATIRVRSVQNLLFKLLQLERQVYFMHELNQREQGAASVIVAGLTSPSFADLDLTAWQTYIFTQCPLRNAYSRLCNLYNHNNFFVCSW